MRLSAITHAGAPRRIIWRRLAAATRNRWRARTTPRAIAIGADRIARVALARHETAIVTKR
jgi:hypothetical protein